MTKDFSTNNRIELFDIARGIGMILIIIMHTSYIPSQVRAYITNFDMPLFFIISGMLMVITKESERDLKATILKKCKTFLVPYAWFSLILLFIHAVNIYFGYFTIGELVTSLVHTLTLYGDSILWFLPALLLGESIVLLLVKMSDERKTLLVFLIGSIAAVIIEQGLVNVCAINADNTILILAVDFFRVWLRGIIAGLFVSIGYVIMQKMGSSLIMSDTKRRAVNFFEGVMLLCMLLPISMANGPCDFHRLVFNKHILYLGGALLGSLGILLISSGISRFLPLSFIGRNSLIVMCTHLDCYVLFGAIQIAWLIDRVVTRAKSYVFMFNIVLFTLLIEIPIILIINRFLPFLTGKKTGRDHEGK